VELNRLLKGHTDIRKFTETLDEVIQSTCRETCKRTNAPEPKVKVWTLPWWKDALKTMMKRTNALRRYQGTTGYAALSEVRSPYDKAKKDYQTAIRREKTRSWKQYCTTTSSIFKAMAKTMTAFYKKSLRKDVSLNTGKYQRYSR